MIINPGGLFLFLFCAIVVVMIAVFAGAPAIFWALGVWGLIVLWQVT